MPAKTPSAKVLEFQKQPPPGTPLPMPDLSDIDRIHRLVAGNHLADILTRIAGKH